MYWGPEGIFNLVFHPSVLFPLYTLLVNNCAKRSLCTFPESSSCRCCSCNNKHFKTCTWVCTWAWIHNFFIGVPGAFSSSQPRPLFSSSPCSRIQSSQQLNQHFVTFCLFSGVILLLVKLWQDQKDENNLWVWGGPWQEHQRRHRPIRPVFQRLLWGSGLHNQPMYS